MAGQDLHLQVLRVLRSIFVQRHAAVALFHLRGCTVFLGEVEDRQLLGSDADDHALLCLILIS